MDAARAAAVLMVTAFHVWRLGKPQYDIAGIDLFTPMAWGFAGVDVFFVVSGYAMVLTWDRQIGNTVERVKGFWIARLLRLYPSYVFAIAFWLLALEMTGRAKPSHGPEDIASHLLFIHTLSADTFYSVSGVFWTLAVEVHFYLLFPLLILAPRLVRLSAVLASIAYIIWTYPDQATPATDPWRLNVVTFLPLFVLGIEFARGTIAKSIPWIATAAAVLLIFIVPADSRGDIWQFFGRLVVGGGIALGCLALPRIPPANALSPAVMLIGSASYSIYLYNYAFTLLRPGHDLLGWTTSFAAIFIAGLTAWYFVERPAEHLRRRWMERRRSSASRGEAETPVSDKVTIVEVLGPAPR